MRDIKYKSPQLSHEKATEIAISYMAQENAEYLYLKDSVPENVKKLDKFKAEAKELAQALGSVRNSVC